MELDSTGIAALPSRYRAHLINSISGFKSAQLIGTADRQGNTNLAIFNSVVHLGANPPLMGFILRPDVVERHTLQNILETGTYTFNAISVEIYKQAHQSAAKYPKSVSEFEACKLTAHYFEGFPAPFVKESPIKIGLTFVEQLLIQSNNTRLIVGKIERISLEDQMLCPDGFVRLDQGNIMSISNLDAYFQPIFVDRLSYAEPDKPLQSLG